MQSNDARILRGAAVPTALVGCCAVVVGAVLAGGEGALSAALGTALVAAFFALGLYALGRIGERWPELLMGAALAVYAAQILLLLIPLGLLRDATFVHGRVFGLTMLVCVVTWLASQTRAQLRLKVPYVQPDPPAEASQPEPRS